MKHTFFLIWTFFLTTYSSVPNKLACSPYLILTKLSACTLLFGPARLFIFLDFFWIFVKYLGLNLQKLGLFSGKFCLRTFQYIKIILLREWTRKKKKSYWSAPSIDTDYIWQICNLNLLCRSNCYWQLPDLTIAY